jgi:hypothetical protein
MHCEHEACHCEAPDAERYCSQQCRDAAQGASREAACACGHAECDQEAG